MFSFYKHWFLVNNYLSSLPTRPLAHLDLKQSFTYASFCFRPKFHFIVIFSLFIYFKLCFPSPPLLSTPTKQTSSHRNLFFNDENINIKKCKIEINSYNALQNVIFVFGLVTLLCLFYLYLCHHVCYVAFSTNLNLYSVKKSILISPHCICIYLSLLILGLL